MVSAKFMGRKNVESPQIADKIGQNIVEKVIIFLFFGDIEQQSLHFTA